MEVPPLAECAPEAFRPRARRVTPAGVTRNAWTLMHLSLGRDGDSRLKRDLPRRLDSSARLRGDSKQAEEGQMVVPTCPRSDPCDRSTGALQHPVQQRRYTP